MNLAMDRQIEEIIAVCDTVRARKRSGKQLFLSFDEWNVWYRARGGDFADGKRTSAPKLLEEVYNLEDALLVGGFLIANTFAMVVAQRSREMALLRAVGATRRQVTRALMLEAITRSYKNYLENTFQKNSNQVVALITKAKEDMSKELQKRDAEYLEFRRKSSVLASNEMGRTFIAQRLEQAGRASRNAIGPGP